MRHILRNASRPAGAAAPSLFKRFQLSLTGSSEKGFENPMSKGEAAKILGVRSVFLNFFHISFLVFLDFVYVYFGLVHGFVFISPMKDDIYSFDSISYPQCRLR